MLLVVFLNTTLGAWLHESLHLAESGTRPPAVAGGAEAPSPDGEPDEQLHPICVWCLTQAHYAPGGAPPAVLAAPLSGSAAPSLSRSATLPPHAHRWPFAARDPPPHPG
ncbi:hypothetical protein [Caldimonas tepidiphila]|uniref:hypothetical protein n=1 Tax=Caldimonas tepidiphila TaxID=2315841 RepID=UPI0013005A9D|nr:hypothetical protein [Caldimonas tepidiphila]